MDYLHTKERKGGLIEHGLGDWGRDIAFGNHQANIETAIYYKCLRNVELMAQELGRREEADKYSTWAERIYKAYNDNLLVTTRGEHPYAFYTSLDNPGTHDRTMIAQAMALQYDLVPPEYKADVTRAFIDDCQDCKIRAGEIGLRYLWNTLADVDRPDIVLAMARREEHPSYMRFIRRGETTLLEFWQDECRSKSHDMLGTIYEWCYEAVLGVRVEEDGYRRWSVRPPLNSEFGRVEGAIDCPYGNIEVMFERASDGGGTRLRVRVPTGTVGAVLLPESSKVQGVREGDNDVRVFKGPRVELRQGTYELNISL